MLKRKVKQFVSLLTTLALTGSFALGAMAPASAAEKIKLGESGYVSLHSYTSTTDVENVHKVTFTLDVNTLLKPKDIVFVVDNSGSMGLPEDLSQELDDWVSNVMSGSPSAPSTYATMGGAAGTGLGTAGLSLADDIRMEDPTVAAPGNLWPIPAGSWEYGYEYTSSVFGYPAGEAGAHKLPNYNNGEGYRFEWMKQGLKEAIDLLLGPTNGAASMNRIAVFGFGSGDSDNSAQTNTIEMKGSPNPIAYDWGPYVGWGGGQYGYNWGTAAGDAGAVWANDFNKWYADGLTPGSYPYNEGDPFEWADALTFNSNIANGGSIANIGPNCWITTANYTNLTGTGKAIDTNLVRRQEGTTMAAGLSAAYELLSKSSSDDRDKYVFLLTDGTETSARTDTVNRSNWPEMDYSESLALATNLKRMGVNMHGLGILEQEASVFVNGTFDASKFDSSYSLTYDEALPGTYANDLFVLDGTRHPVQIPLDLRDYVLAKPYIRTPAGASNTTDPYIGEEHLLRVLTPLKSNAPIMAKTASDYTASSFPRGSSYMILGGDASFPIFAGPGYDTMVNDLVDYGDFSKIKYNRANDKNGVIRVFKEFAKSLFAASSITPDITLGNAFSIYQMPGKSLFECTGGSTATGGNRSINWSIPNIAATGGSVSLSFYVKVDPANADPNNMWQGLLEHFMIDYVDFNEDLASKGLPQNYVLPTGTPDTEVKEIDHRLDDSKYPVSLTRKTETPAFIASLSSKGDIAVSDVKAQAIGKGKAKLTVESPDRDKLYFQWQYLDTETGEWISIKGANASIFTVTGLKAGDYTFRCAIRTATSVFSFTKEVKVTVK